MSDRMDIWRCPDCLACVPSGEVTCQRCGLTIPPGRA